MPLHRQKHPRDTPETDVYATRAMEATIPKHRIPADGLRPDVALQFVVDELMLDGNSRQNLATFCQTWFDDAIHQLMDLSLDKNMIDKDEYPATAEIESRCVHLLAHLWNSPAAGTTIGCSTTGSSEGAMLGGLALKWKWRERRAKLSKPSDKPNIVTGPVQVCWHKFARYFDVELREIPLERDRLGMTPADVIAARRREHDRRRADVSASRSRASTNRSRKSPKRSIDLQQRNRDSTFPSTSTRRRADSSRRSCGRRLLWDFRLPRVRSINTSGHKFGLAPLGVGWVIWREAADLPEGLIFHVNYLGGDMPTFALNFSRPGGQVICQYYLMLRLGMDGYRRIHQKLLRRRAAHRAPDRRNGAVRTALRRRQPSTAFRPYPGRCGKALGPAIRSSISPTGCAGAAGKSQPTRWSRTSPTRSSCASWYGTDRASTSPTDCSKTFVAPSSISRRHPLSKPMTAAEGATHNHDARPKHALH